jgi:ribonuclease-3
VSGGAKGVVLKNVLRRLCCRIRLQWFSQFSRDEQFKLLVEKLRSTKFDFARFTKAIQYYPCNWKLFLQALLHRSYLQFLEERWNSNERLEFLGDAILNFIVAEHLFRTYPDMEEGELTKLRSRLVNRKILAQRAKDLHLSDYLLLSSSAAQSIDSGSESIIADAVESVIGAIYLDGGLESVRKFIYATLLKNTEVFNSAIADDNYKSTLLEYTQARALGIPRYSVIHEEGPEHDRRFTIEVSISDQSYGSGFGRSKKEAEQAAAARALEHIHLNSLHSKTENENIETEK